MRKTVDVIIPTFRPGVEFVKIVDRLKKQTVDVRNIYILNSVNITRSGNSVRSGIIGFADNISQVRQNGIQAKDNSILTFEDSERTRVSIFNIMKEDFDHGATRDYGIALSDSEYIVMMSQNALPMDNRLLEKLIEPFEESVVAATYARHIPSKSANCIDKFTMNYNFPKVSKIKSGADIKDIGMQTYFCSNACAAYRKSVYDELGGFEVRTIFNEEVVMAAKIINAGYKVAYVSEARIRNLNTFTFRQKVQRSFDLGVSVKHFRKYFKVNKSGMDSVDRIKDTCLYLSGNNKGYLIPMLFVYEIAEWIGYKAGYNYEQLPNVLVKKLSSNKDYWRR